MATIKSYSDLQQSKKLAEILPLESADMYWFRNNTESPKVYPEDMMKDSVCVTSPCWSLAALISVLPYPHIEQNYKGKWICRVEYENTTYLWEDSNPVDACVAMIEKLNELKML